MSDPAEAQPETTLTERQLRMLDRLAEAGLQIALVIERRVKDAEPDEPLAALTAAGQAYDRVARAVRLSIQLQSHLVKDRDDQADAVRQRPAKIRQQHRDRVVGIIKRIASDHWNHEPFAVSAMAREAAERLDTDDIYGLILTRPVGELVALICRDFGLEPDWGALAQEAWAQAEMDSEAEGSPFVEDISERVLHRAAGEVAQRAGGGISPPPSVEEACGLTTFPSSAPDG